MRPQASSIAGRQFPPPTALVVQVAGFRVSAPLEIPVTFGSSREWQQVDQLPLLRSIAAAVWFLVASSQLYWVQSLASVTV